MRKAGQISIFIIFGIALSILIAATLMSRSEVSIPALIDNPLLPELKSSVEECLRETGAQDWADAYLGKAILARKYKAIDADTFRRVTTGVEPARIQRLQRAMKIKTQQIERNRR